MGMNINIFETAVCLDLNVTYVQLSYIQQITKYKKEGGFV
ncbi:hypothetical protein B481_1858 [Planococcus halocryophilus Or1]|nr:hypothetical protein B481_1858 [Planococcus halocryophilus Or1]